MRKDSIVTFDLFGHVYVVNRINYRSCKVLPHGEGLNRTWRAVAASRAVFGKETLVLQRNSRYCKMGIYRRKQFVYFVYKRF